MKALRILLVLISLIAITKASCGNLTPNERQIEDGNLIEDEMVVTEEEDEVEEGTQQEDEIVEHKNNIIEETNENVDDTPTSYDVKDEKICRKKRNAEKLSKIIRKTSENVHGKSQQKSQKVMENANDASSKVKRDTKTKKEGTLRQAVNKKSSKIQHIKGTEKAHGNKKQKKQKNGKTLAKKSSKKRSNKKNEL